MKKIIITTLLLFNAILNFAHNPDQSYLYLDIYEDRIEGRFEAVSKNMNPSIDLQLPKQFTLAELEAALPKIYDYILKNVSFKDENQTFEIEFTEFKVLENDVLGNFAILKFDLNGLTTVPEEITIDYNMYFDSDKRHRALLLQGYNWKAGIINNESVHSAIFSPKRTNRTLNLSKYNFGTGFWGMIRMGMYHIWIGIDHILFLIALLLPSVVRRRKTNAKGFAAIIDQWEGVDQFKSAFWYILKIVTFFTIAHTITLTLATLGWVKLPSALVESIIAFSIALAAFHNIKPIFGNKEWLIVFFFGLFHGFGFAGVLAEKGIQGEYLLPTLLGFNIGVELGQVLIILAVFPILYLLRKQKIYPYIIFFGSVGLILMGLVWTIERIFGINIPFGEPLKKIKAIFS